VEGQSSACSHPGEETRVHPASKGNPVKIPEPLRGRVHSLGCAEMGWLAGQLVGCLVFARQSWGCAKRRQRQTDLWDAGRDPGKRSLFLITDFYGVF